MPSAPGVFFSRILRLSWTVVALVVLACSGRSTAQSPSPDRPVVPARSLIATPLAGQKIAVLPLTLLVTDPAVGSDSRFVDRVAALHWSDSLLGLALERRAPEVVWVLPAELRRIARRAPGVAPDPDRMGQSIMGAPKLDFLPDPLRSYSRSLVALAGGRTLLIPAAFSFSAVPEGGIKAELAIVLADARNGKVIWRTLMPGQGATAAFALDAALQAMLPLPTDAP